MGWERFWVERSFRVERGSEAAFPSLAHAHAHYYVFIRLNNKVKKKVKPISSIGRKALVRLGLRHLSTGECVGGTAPGCRRNCTAVGA